MDYPGLFSGRDERVPPRADPTGGSFRNSLKLSQTLQIFHLSRILHLFVNTHVEARSEWRAAQTFWPILKVLLDSLLNLADCNNNTGNNGGVASFGSVDCED